MEFLVASDNEDFLPLLGIAATGAAAAIYEILSKAISPIRSKRYPVKSHVTFREVVRYFQDESPDDIRIKSWALLRCQQPGKDGVVLFYLFLGQDNSPIMDDDGRPLGQAVRALEIDDELEQNFGGTDLIKFS